MTESASVPSPQPEPEAEDDGVPLHTKRTAFALMDQFWDALIARATAIQHGRKSQTLTDSDLADAYRDLTTKSDTPKRNKIAGDLLMIGGGPLVSLWSSHWLLTVAGVALCAAGLYIRECAEK